MKKVYRAGALLLALTLLVTLCACGGGSQDPSATEAPAFVYVPAYTKLPAEVTEMSNSCWYDGGFYFTCYAKTGTETYTDPETGETSEYDAFGQCLYYMKEDGTGLTKLANYAAPAPPEGMEGNAYINRLTIDATGNLWLCEYLSAYKVTEGGDGSGGGVAVAKPMAYATAVASSSDIVIDGGAVPEYIDKFYIRKLDSTGAELFSVDLSTFAEGDDGTQDVQDYRGGGFYPNGLELDGAGNIYFTNGQSDIFVLEPGGALKCKLSFEDGYLNNLIRLSDGRIAAMVYRNGANGEMGENTITVIDPEAKTWGESVSAPFNAYNFYPGGGGYDFYYNTDSNFFGFNLSAGAGEKLFNWINCDIDSYSITSVIPLSDGRILCSVNNWNKTDGTNTCEIATLTKTDASQVQQKTVLTYACMYLDYNLRSKIIEFNKTNAQYRIEVNDYSEYNTQDDYNAGITKLSTEIIAGNVPDILATSNLPLRQYAAKGLLEDLWPFIDGDPELGRGAVMEQIFKALEQDGKLYQVSPGFSVFTAAGAPSIVGDKPGWTLDELYAALAKLPEGAEVFNMYTVQRDILQQCCAMAMDEFVNWETGACSFDSPEFIKMLEFAKRFPAEFDYENYDWETDYESDYSRIKNGKQLLVSVYNGDFQQFQMYKAMFGGSVTYIGFPTESRNGNAFMVQTGLAMSSQCKDKQGAWQFIRTVLSKEYQENSVWGEFPTNREVFDKKLKETMTPEYIEDPVTGEQVEQPKGSWGWDRDLTVDIYAMTQEEADQVMELINTTNRIYAYDQEIFEIISEDTAAYFSGQKSAEEIAKLIQNRVSLYVNEQK
jgi:ABC-type glycerol-3-phosphate transport system substrate-binding protein